MASTINSNTTDGVIITPDTSGEIELQSSGTTIATVKSTGLEMASGKNLVTTAPAFSLVKTSHQTISTGTVTKVTYDSAEFDLTSDADLTNNKVVPSVEGYYLIDFNYRFSGITDGGQTYSSIRKNGSEVKRGMQYNNGASAGAHGNSTHLLYFNGTTDYLETFVYQGTGANRSLISGSQYTTLSGFLARAV